MNTETGKTSATEEASPCYLTLSAYLLPLRHASSHYFFKEGICTEPTKKGCFEKLFRLFAETSMLGKSLAGIFRVHLTNSFSRLFVGAMLMIFALTGLCAMSIIFYLFGA